MSKWVKLNLVCGAVIYLDPYNITIYEIAEDSKEQMTQLRINYRRGLDYTTGNESNTMRVKETAQQIIELLDKARSCDLEMPALREPCQPVRINKTEIFSC